MSTCQSELCTLASELSPIQFSTVSCLKGLARATPEEFDANSCEFHAAQVLYLLYSSIRCTLASLAPKAEKPFNLQSSQTIG